MKSYDEGAGNISRAFFMPGTNCTLARYRYMPSVQSAAIRSLAYDDKTQALRATFRGNGRTYEYRGVPEELYDALLFADSIGAFFNAHVRDVFPHMEL